MNIEKSNRTRIHLICFVVLVVTDYSKISRNVNALMDFCNFMKENGGSLVNTNFTGKHEKKIDIGSFRKA